MDHFLTNPKSTPFANCEPGDHSQGLGQGEGEEAWGAGADQSQPRLLFAERSGLSDTRANTDSGGAPTHT